MTKKDGRDVDSAQGFVAAVVTEVDTDLSVGRPHRLTSRIKKMLNGWSTSHEESAPPDGVRWEILALDIRAVPRSKRSDTPDERFRPKFELVNRDTEPPTMDIYPDVAALMADQQAIAYFRQRAQDTSNPIRKARYADFIWCASKGQDKDAYRYAIEAANAYLAQAPLCIEQERYIQLVEALDRAGEIAVMLNKRDLAAQVVEAMANSVFQLVSPPRFRWVMNASDSLFYISTRFPDVATETTWKQFMEICSEGIAYYESVDNYHLARVLMQKAGQISEYLGDDAMVWTYRVNIAESFEKEAEQKGKAEGVSGGSLAALRLMEDATHLYQQLVSLAPDDTEMNRLQAKVQKTRRDVRRLIRQAEDEMELISSSAEVPREAIEEAIAPLLEVEPESTLSVLSVAPFLLLDVEDLRREASEAAEKSVFANLLGRATLRDGRKVDEIPPMEGETAQFFDHLSFWFQTHAQFLDIILSRLREEGRFSQELFLQHLQNWEFLDEADVPFIKVGLDRYFSDDHVSALHILVPRIEHILKSVFEQAGLPLAVIPNKRQIREQTFGDFLRRQEVRGILGKDIWHYLYYLLVDERGINLRNDVAHGWITYLACNRLTVQMALFAILLLTNLYRPRESGEEESDGIPCES
jgi:hypothetical protein